ncbi:MAG: NAD(P)H-binding protein [Streptosporangiales bacterium]|nr:NAD(P)H-binding protein [Streptosporangiales bacterium]
MYAITGVTGHAGGATAQELLATGERVRAVVRDPAKGNDWSRNGADVAVADFTDRAALTRALSGSRGAFVMLPTVPTGADADHRRLADSIAGAVGDSGVPHVVALSSIGADLAEGTGPIRWLHHLENRLRDTGAVVTALRSPHFQEKVETVLGAATNAGVYPVFAESADIETPMVATRDIATAAARALLSPPSASEIVDLDAPSYTERQVAERLAAVLGKPLDVVTVPRADWVGVLVDAGAPPVLAEELAALYAAEHDGLPQPRGDRRHLCTTGIEHTLQQVVQVAA